MSKTHILFLPLVTSKPPAATAQSGKCFTLQQRAKLKYVIWDMEIVQGETSAGAWISAEQQKQQIIRTQRAWAAPALTDRSSSPERVLGSTDTVSSSVQERGPSVWAHHPSWRDPEISFRRELAVAATRFPQTDTQSPIRVKLCCTCCN